MLCSPLAPSGLASLRPFSTTALVLVSPCFSQLSPPAAAHGPSPIARSGFTSPIYCTSSRLSSAQAFPSSGHVLSIQSGLHPSQQRAESPAWCPWPNNYLPLFPRGLLRHSPVVLRPACIESCRIGPARSPNARCATHVSAPTDPLPQKVLLAPLRNMLPGRGVRLAVLAWWFAASGPDHRTCCYHSSPTFSILSSRARTHVRRQKQTTPRMACASLGSCHPTVQEAKNNGLVAVIVVLGSQRVSTVV